MNLNLTPEELGELYEVLDVTLDLLEGDDDRTDVLKRIMDKIDGIDLRSVA